MLFSELVESELDPALRQEVAKLLDLKMNSPETKIIPRNELLNEYLDSSIAEVRSCIEKMPEEIYHDWEELDQLFLTQLK